jgi:hypothetical protein
LLDISHPDGAVRVTTGRYRLTWATDRPFVYVDDGAGRRVGELFVLSSVHSTSGQDDTVRIGSWTVEEQAGLITLTLSAESSVWRAKRYTFKCFPDRFQYQIAVEGHGLLTDVSYFGGYYSGHLRWGSGFFWSGQHFEQGFNSEPSGSEIYSFPSSGGSVIDMVGVPLPGRFDWFFTPPPFCFAFAVGEGWLGVGVEAEAGANRFTELRYHGQLGAFYLTLSYEGYTRVDGRYDLPAIGFDFAETPYDAIAQHVAALHQQGLVAVSDSGYHPGWWHTPIYCGWGSQCYVAALRGGRAPDYARQNLYEDFLATLAAHELHPGIVVLDDKWQSTYGENRVNMEKWPDVRGFIGHRHAAGQKVLLWLKAWDPEGIPADECVTNAGGMPVAVDPTNPKFERRLRESIRIMLGADGYDADGFKIDFTARIPSGPALRVHGNIWGLELMRCYLAIIHDEAHRVKPDALVMTHTPHPYLADVVDMIRLNDINTGKDVIEAMTHRAKIAAIACPNAVIDTDNWPITNKAVWREYVRLQPSLGVPSLYYASHIDTTREPLDEEDYALIRSAWKEYQDKLGASHA